MTGRGRVVLPYQRGLGLHYEWQREGGPCVRGGLWTSRSIPAGLRTSSSPPPGRLQTEAGPRPSAGSLRGRDCAWTRCRLVSAMPCLPSVGGPTRVNNDAHLLQKKFFFFFFLMWFNHPAAMRLAFPRGSELVGADGLSSLVAPRLGHCAIPTSSSVLAVREDSFQIPRAVF